MAAPISAPLIAAIVPRRSPTLVEWETRKASIAVPLDATPQELRTIARAHLEPEIVPESEVPTNADLFEDRVLLAWRIARVIATREGWLSVDPPGTDTEIPRLFMDADRYAPAPPAMTREQLQDQSYNPAVDKRMRRWVEKVWNTANEIGCVGPGHARHRPMWALQSLVTVETARLAWPAPDQLVDLELGLVQHVKRSSGMGKSPIDILIDLRNRYGIMPGEGKSIIAAVLDAVHRSHQMTRDMRRSLVLDSLGQSAQAAMRKDDVRTALQAQKAQAVVAGVAKSEDEKGVAQTMLEIIRELAGKDEMTTMSTGGQDARLAKINAPALPPGGSSPDLGDLMGDSGGALEPDAKEKDLGDFFAGNG